jgi:glycosyltransferase involved in cell wall biosynthesis
MKTNRIRKLTVIIPAYNEGSSIHLILEKVRNVSLLQGIAKEVIIVDDCSTDGSESIISRYMDENPGMEIRFFRHQQNRGKGAALRTGIGKATGEYLIIQDADLEYDPSDYNRLLKPVVEGMADVVYGSREVRLTGSSSSGIPSGTNSSPSCPTCSRT